jgi:hypothetical protein
VSCSPTHPGLLLGLTILSSTACSDSGLTRVDTKDTFYQEKADGADILWVIDDSISMADEQALVAAGFRSFLGALGDLDADTHLAVISTDMDLSNEQRGEMRGETPFLKAGDDYETEFRERVQVGTSGSDKERGIQAAHHALTAEDLESQWGGFLRDGTVLALIFVSDENDCSDENQLPDDAPGSDCYEHLNEMVPVVDYIRAFQELRGEEGRVVASSIIGPPAGEACDGTWYGSRYDTLSEKLDGYTGDICESDYGSIMEDLGERLIGPTRVFFLDYSAISDSITVWVDDEEIERSSETGWSYDSEVPSIRFDGSYVPSYGSVIEAKYDILD